MPVQVSMVVGGESSANAPTKQALLRLQRVALETSEHHPATTGGIQFVFHLSGPIFQPDYQGVRTGAYRRAKRQLEVQIAVPERLETAPNAFLAASLEAGLRLAEDYANLRHRDLSLDMVRQVTAEILRKLTITETEDSQGGD